MRTELPGNQGWVSPSGLRPTGTRPPAGQPPGTPSPSAARNAFSWFWRRSRNPDQGPLSSPVRWPAGQRRTPWSPAYPAERKPEPAAIRAPDPGSGAHLRRHHVTGGWPAGARAGRSRAGPAPWRPLAPTLVRWVGSPGAGVGAQKPCALRAGRSPRGHGRPQRPWGSG